MSQLQQVDTPDLNTASARREQAAKKQRADAEQWLDALLAQDRAARIRMASVAVSKSEDLDRGQQCWMGDHTERLAADDARRRAISDALDDLHSNCIPEMSEAGQAAAKSVAARLAAAAGFAHRAY